MNQSSRNIFHYKGLSIETNSEVYEPAEDTFLLLEAIEIDKKDKVLEIGTGCGIIGIESARRGAEVVCSDINPHAIRIAESNYKKNKDKLEGIIDFRQGDMFSILKNDEKFDKIIFNPPYLPTYSDDEVGGWFDVATDGGRNGLKLIKRFIDNLDKYLKNNGHAYFVLSSLSNTKKLKYFLFSNKLIGQVLISKWFDDERLDVYCIKVNKKLIV